MRFAVSMAYHPHKYLLQRTPNAKPFPHLCLWQKPPGFSFKKKLPDCVVLPRHRSGTCRGDDFFCSSTGLVGWLTSMSRALEEMVPQCQNNQNNQYQNRKNPGKFNMECYMIEVWFKWFLCNWMMFRWTSCSSSGAVTSRPSSPVPWGHDFFGFFGCSTGAFVLRRLGFMLKLMTQVAAK